MAPLLAIFMIIALGATIKDLYILFLWLPKKKAKATITKLEDKLYNYKSGDVVSSVEYVYLLSSEVNSQQITTKFTEKISGDKASKYQVGDELSIFYSDKDKISMDKKYLVKKFLVSLSFFVVSLGLLILICYISDLLSM